MSEKVRAADDFAQALRVAVAERGLSLERIRFHLARRGHDLSIATLSYWQSGRSRPDRAASLAALGTLEEILQVRRGHLAAKLPQARRRNPVSLPAATLSTVLPIYDDGRILDDTVARMGLTWDGGLRRVSVHDIVTIGPDRAELSKTSRELLVATQSGVDRYPLAHIFDGTGDMYDFIPTLNCRAGRVWQHDDRRLQVAEIVLDRPLLLGESILIEFRVDSPLATAQSDGWLRGFTHQVREAIMVVTFHPDALPTAAESFVAASHVDEVTPLPIGHGTVTLQCSDVGPGRCGLRWTWPN